MTRRAEAEDPTIMAGLFDLEWVQGFGAYVSGRTQDSASTTGILDGLRPRIQTTWPEFWLGHG